LALAPKKANAVSGDDSSAHHGITHEQAQRAQRVPRSPPSFQTARARFLRPATWRHTFDRHHEGHRIGEPKRECVGSGCQTPACRPARSRHARLSPRYRRRAMSRVRRACRTRSCGMRSARTASYVRVGAADGRVDGRIGDGTVGAGGERSPCLALDLAHPSVRVVELAVLDALQRVPQGVQHLEISKLVFLVLVGHGRNRHRDGRRATSTDLTE